MALLLGFAACAYLGLLTAIFVQLTSPGSFLPNLEELDDLVFDTQRPSRVERLLEASGERIEGGGTMRPAFTADSVGWEETISGLSEGEKARLLAEREGERQALLAWVRSDARRDAYDQDEYSLPDGSIHQVTPKYVSMKAAGAPAVRIRSLITDRCVTCHSEDGRHDTARFIPLDSFEQLAPRLRPEAPDVSRRPIVAALALLTPFALLCGIAFWHSSQPFHTRLSLVTLTSVAIALMLTCWFTGRAGTWHGSVMLASVAAGTLAVTVQWLATLNDLATRPHTALGAPE